MKRFINYALIAFGLIAAGTVGFGVFKGVETSDDSSALTLEPLEPAVLDPVFQERQLPLSDITQSLKQSNLDELMIEVSLFKAGKFLSAAWYSGLSLTQGIEDAYQRALKKTGKLKVNADSLVLTLATRSYELDSRSTSNIYRGYRGVRVNDSKGPYFLSPLTAVIKNESLATSLDNAAKRRGKTRKEWLNADNAITFDTQQYFIDLKTNSPAKKFFRGQELFTLAEVNADSVKEFESRLTDWLFNNLNKNGRMTYQYYPSSGRESTSNNMIRQWMASVALGRSARQRVEEQENAFLNIRYNLRSFYKEKKDFGFIEYSKKAKLGAAALALISIIESPRRSAFKNEETRLLKLTHDMWQNSGRFQTFYKPAARSNENSLHNFYPGETLLAWALLYDDTRDPLLLERSMKSFEYYRIWHLAHRNPAFIPWHTQAYYRLWTHTHSAKLKDWIFEMNDWLVKEMQGESSWQYIDTEGRFYNANKRYGKPHASATGVYLEGLIDAFALARETGDTQREERYRRSILLGLRSSIQLQFRNSSDMFFSDEQTRLRGGMRTTVYNNVIRVDNVQHVLMAAQKIVKTFKPEDYR